MKAWTSFATLLFLEENIICHTYTVQVFILSFSPFTSRRSKVRVIIMNCIFIFVYKSNAKCDIAICGIFDNIMSFCRSINVIFSKEYFDLIFGQLSIIAPFEVYVLKMTLKEKKSQKSMTFIKE